MRNLFVPPLAFFLAGCVLAGCGTANAPVTAPPAATTTPPLAPTPATVDPCSVHTASFRAALASASGACTTSIDCACYNPVVGEAGFGGVTDAATAARLGAIEAAFHVDGCPWPHLCEATACNPVCVAGRCQSGALGLGVGGS